MCPGSFLFWGEKTTIRRNWVLKECGVWNGLENIWNGSPLRLSGGRAGVKGFFHNVLWRNREKETCDVGSWEFDNQCVDREMSKVDYDCNIPRELKEFMENLSLLQSTV